MLTLASIMSLSAYAQSGKVGFLLSENPSDQENAAYQYFSEVYGEDNVIKAEDGISKANYDCIWIHIDRKGFNYEALPALFKSDKISQFVKDGGDLYLSGHATTLLVPMGRLEEKHAPNVIATGDGGYNGHDWNINADFAGQDFRNHPIYTGLRKNSQDGHETFGLLGAGTKEDHNSLWSFEGIFTNDNDPRLNNAAHWNRVNSFQFDTKCKVLGAWGQTTGDQNAGIIEFLPMGDFKGTIIANGLAAYQWYMHNGEKNSYEDNLKLLTSNILSYLAPEDGELPNTPEEFDPTSLDSSRRVAIFVGYEDESKLNAAQNREGKAIYNFFKARYPDNIHFVDDLDNLFRKDGEKYYYDCIWIHFDRENTAHVNEIINDLNEKHNGCGTQLVEKLEAFHEAGGNLYLTKQAAFLVNSVDPRLPNPNENNYTETKQIDETWYANVTHNYENHSQHPIFQSVNLVDYLGMKMVEINSGDNHRQDNTSVYAMKTLCGSLQNFCNNYNANVLATWGHNDHDAMSYAGIVEFKPSQAAQYSKMRRAKSGIPAESRRGVIIVNGMGGYEWSLPEGKNESLDQIQKMTENVLAYLSPATEVIEENVIEVSEVNTNEGEKFSLAFDPKGIIIMNAIEFDKEIASDLVITLTSINDSKSWTTYIGDEIERQYLLLEEAIYNQWYELGATDSGVDGFFTGDEDLYAELSLNEDDSSEDRICYDIRITAPCSGIYNLSIVPRVGANVNLVNETGVDISKLVVEIYPNLYGTFGTENNAAQGFNINGYTFTPPTEGKENYTILIPVYEDFANAMAYIPGTYFSSPLDVNTSLYNNVKRREDALQSVFATPVDLSSLNTEDETELNVGVTKNGASHTFSFVVQKDVSTGVGLVPKENTEAVFYNLHGIKVNNPEKGVYIKVEGGKTSKVTL